MISDDNTAFFTTANNNYAVNATCALLTVRDHLPNASLWVIGRGFNDKNKKMFDSKGINYIEFPIKKYFSKTGNYPIECFAMFAGPQLLLKHGFDYSVYLDGDVVCLANPLANKGGELITGVAGVGYGKAVEKFNLKRDVYAKIFHYHEECETMASIQTGIIYFNNTWCEDIALLAKAKKVFDLCVNSGDPRKGDDSLFSLLQVTEFKPEDVLLLPVKYNYIPYAVKLHDENDNTQDDDIVFMHCIENKPWRHTPYKHSIKELGRYNFGIKRWRRKLFGIAPLIWFLTNFSENNILVNICNKIILLPQKLEDLSNDTVKTFRPYIQSAQGLRYSPNRCERNYHEPPLRVYWRRSKKNFGDQITKPIIESLFGRKVIWTPNRYCMLMGAGSILGNAEGLENCVWGSGSLKPLADDAPTKQNLRFYAVRGDLTKEQVEKDIPVGDPGLLVNLVFPYKIIPKSVIGVVPRHNDKNHPLVRAMKKDVRFVVMNAAWKPRRIAKEISQCTLVLSSSLHGLIFADSFGVPNIRINLSSQVKNGNYDFYDYYSAIGKEYKEADLDLLFDNKYLSELRNEYVPINNLKKIQRNLVKAFPY